MYIFVSSICQKCDCLAHIYDRHCFCEDFPHHTVWLVLVWLQSAHIYLFSLLVNFIFKNSDTIGIFFVCNEASLQLNCYKCIQGAWMKLVNLLGLIVEEKIIIATSATLNLTPILVWFQYLLWFKVQKNQLDTFWWDFVEK